ncbi:MAG: hypothetical protein Q9194_005095 [Teloschistes cf. exilis]
MLSSIECLGPDEFGRRRYAAKQKKSDNINDNAGTQATISEDLADGQTTNLDANLKLLSEESKLLLPNDLEDDEIYSVDPDRKLLSEGNPSSFHDVPAARQYKRRDRESLREQAQAAAGQMPEPSHDENGKRRPARHSRANKSNAVNGYGPEDMPQDYETLYMTKCDESHAAAHAARVFRDVPSVMEATDPRSGEGTPRAHLSGTNPVIDLQAFMENEKDGIAFVAIRTVQCSEASVRMMRTDGSSSLCWTEAIYTKSKLLKQAMQKTATCHFQPVGEEQLFEQNLIDPGDLFLYHHHNLLRNHAKGEPVAEQHIESLLRYADKRFGGGFAKADSLFASGMVDQEHLLHLFKPNELVISRIYGKPAAFVVLTWPFLGRFGSVDLNCWFFQTDGRGFARKEIMFRINPIDAKITAIQNLSVYPLKFAPKELQEMILRRGEMHWDLRTATQVTYKGWNVAQDQIFKWIRIFVDNIHPVSWNKKAFERLVLPPRTKDLVQALVTVRTSQRDIEQGLGVAGERIDITSGKGNGLIMLLHGGPGTGKTLTAESVAEIAEMPLYRVTCGDVGTNPEAVERYLNTVLHLGKIWNCVLLLDEMDVFLEERSMSDL